MSTATRSLREVFSPAELSVKRITLCLRALILPIGRPLIRQRVRQLLDERRLGVQGLEALLRLVVPVHAAVLLAGAADAAEARHGDPRGLHLLRQAVEDEVERLHPHGDGGVDLARLVADVDALFHAVLGGKVAVKVDLGLGGGLEG